MSEKPIKSIKQLIEADGRYPLGAVEFVREGLGYTVDKYLPEVEAEQDYGSSYDAKPARGPRHVSGGQLCMGLRHLAWKKWGFMARSVLKHWRITRTRDFGEIVFLLVEHGWMQKQPQDSIDDFDDVYEFCQAFDRSYKIDLE